MTISDILLLTTFVAGTLYIISRLVVGWLATRSAELATEEPDEVNRSFDEPPTRSGS
jgi:hypothetical protein